MATGSIAEHSIAAISQQLYLIGLRTAVLVAPAVVRNLRDTDLADRVGNGRALQRQHVYLPQLRYDLFWFVSLLRHFRSSSGLKPILRVGPLHWGRFTARTGPSFSLECVWQPYHWTVLCSESEGQIIQNEILQEFDAVLFEAIGNIIRLTQPPGRAMRESSCRVRALD